MEERRKKLIGIKEIKLLAIVSDVDEIWTQKISFENYALTTTPYTTCL